MYIIRKTNFDELSHPLDVGKSFNTRRKRSWSRERKLLSYSKTSAKIKNLEHNLEIKDIIIPNICPVFGIPLNGHGRNDNTPSIDRIDNSKGYLKNNIKIISWRANRLKTNMSLEELKSLVKYVEENI